jgi:hypothetical protein
MNSYIFIHSLLGIAPLYGICYWLWRKRLQNNRRLMAFNVSFLFLFVATLTTASYVLHHMNNAYAKEGPEEEEPFIFVHCDQNNGFELFLTIHYPVCAFDYSVSFDRLCQRPICHLAGMSKGKLTEESPEKSLAFCRSFAKALSAIRATDIGNTVDDSPLAPTITQIASDMQKGKPATGLMCTVNIYPQFIPQISPTGFI